MLDAKKCVVVLLSLYINSIACLNDTSEEGQLVFAHVVNQAQVFPCVKITEISFCFRYLILYFILFSLVVSTW